MKRIYKVLRILKPEEINAHKVNEEFNFRPHYPMPLLVECTCPKCKLVCQCAYLYPDKPFHFYCSCVQDIILTAKPKLYKKFIYKNYMTYEIMLNKLNSQKGTFNENTQSDTNRRQQRNQNRRRK